MSSADLYEDGFPHGTKEGYDRGCRSSACPNAFDGTTICRDANLRYHGDYAYRKAIDAGLTPPEPVALPKPGPTRRAEAVVYDAPVVTVADTVEDFDPDERTDVDESDTDELEVEQPKRRGRPPVHAEHPSSTMYQRGCRKDNECPSFLAGGISCRQAARERERERAAARRAEAAAAAETFADKAEAILTAPAGVEPAQAQPVAVVDEVPAPVEQPTAAAIPEQLAALTSDPAVECSVTVMPTGGFVVVIRIPASVVAA